MFSYLFQPFTRKRWKRLKTVKPRGNLLFACQDNFNNLWLLLHRFQKFALSVKTIRLHHNNIIAFSNLSTLETVFKNNKKRSHTQLDSRKQVIAFQDRVITINIKEAQHPLKREKQVIDKSSIMLKISTKSMHRVLVWEIGPANNTTRCSRLSKRRLLHAWHLSQLAINLSIDKSKWQIHVNNKSDQIPATC